MEKKISHIYLVTNRKVFFNRKLKVKSLIFTMLMSLEYFAPREFPGGQAVRTPHFH